jgi:hypothetical protein
MDGLITATAVSFVGTWEGIKAFFSTIVENIIGGLKEIGNVAKAIGAGIAAAWTAMTSGNFSGIGTAFGDAFMKEFTTQANVQAPNAFDEFGKAYKGAAGKLTEQVGKSGGMNNFLKDEQKSILADIAKNEDAFTKRQQKKKVEEAANPPGKFTPPDIGKAGAAGKPAELPKGAEFGTEEAYKEVLRLTNALRKLRRKQHETRETTVAAMAAAGMKTMMTR